MPRNLEIKIKLESFDFALKILNEIKAEKFATLEQKDVYYRHDKGLLKLRVMPTHDELIFYNRNEKEGERWSDYHVLKISKEENAEKFFEKIMNVETVVEKTRTVYLYKNTRIHLDEVKNLGKFLELETIVTETLEEAKSRFDFLVEKLRLPFENQIKKSYKNLIEQISPRF